MHKGLPGEGKKALADHWDSHRPGEPLPEFNRGKLEEPACGGQLGPRPPPQLHFLPVTGEPEYELGGDHSRSVTKPPVIWQYQGANGITETRLVPKAKPRHGLWKVSSWGWEGPERGEQMVSGKCPFNAPYRSQVQTDHLLQKEVGDLSPHYSSSRDIYVIIYVEELVHTESRVIWISLSAL